MAVSSKDGYGYIDRDGKLVIAHRFQAASLFHDGLAVVAAPAETGFGIPQGSLNLRNPNDGFFEGVIDRSGQFVVSPVYDWAKVRPGGLIHVRFGDRLGYLDSTGKPLTFPAQEIEEHVARKREQLQPPPPGRAVVAKAGDTSYYLHLPDGWCAFDPSVPQDKQVLDDLWAENAAKLEDARKKLPLVTEQEWRNTQKLIDDVRLKVSVLTGCDQLEAIRSGRDKTALRTFAVANGLHKDRYEPSVNGGLLMRVARACTDSLGAPPPKDHSARIWTAFKRLEAGESTQLPALVLDGYACFSAVVTPAESGAGAGPQTHAKAKVGFHTLFVLPNWGVEMHTEETIAATPDALLQALDKQRALIQPFGKANLKRP